MTPASARRDFLRRLALLAGSPGLGCRSDAAQAVAPPAGSPEGFWTPIPPIEIRPGQSVPLGRHWRAPPETTTRFALAPGSAPLPAGVRLDAATGTLHAALDARRGTADGVVLVAHSTPTQSAGGRFVRLVDSAEGPTWGEANQLLRVSWRHSGGDWSDADGTPQGEAAFARATVAGYAVQPVAWSVAVLVRELQTRDAGIFIRQIGGAGWIKFAARGNAQHPPPRLRIETPEGAREAPLLADTWLAPDSPSQGAADVMALPALLKFDLSGIRGPVTSATLTLTSFAQGALNALELGVFRADMPRIVADPARELGGVEHGIAAAVPTSDLDLRRHPDVLVYNEMSSRDEVWNGEWSVIVPRGERGSIPGHVAGDWTLDPLYVHWPEYGLTAGRVTIMGDPGRTTRAGVVAHHWVTPPNKPPWRWQREQGKGYDDLYCRYLLYLDPDVAAGVIPGGGVKLPGMAGTYGVDNAGQYPAGRSAWSYRVEHFGPSPAHPGLFRLFVYAYDWTDPIGTGSGRPLYAGEGLCLEVGRKYCIEQHVRLNTQAADGGWRNDGVLQVWVDGVRVIDIRDRLIRKDANVQIQSIPFLNFYHGGMIAPNADIHYQVTGICAATRYIGPPRRIR